MNAAEPLAILPSGTVVHVDCDDALARWGKVTGPADPRYFEPSALVHVVRLCNGTQAAIARHMLTDLRVVPDRTGLRARFSPVTGRA